LGEHLKQNSQAGSRVTASGGSTVAFSHLSIRRSAHARCPHARHAAPSPRSCAHRSSAARPYQDRVRHDGIQLGRRCGLPGQRALLVVLGDERLHCFLRCCSEVASRVILDPPQRWQILGRHLAKSVLEPARLHPAQLFDESGRSRPRRHELATRVLLGDTSDLGLDGPTVVIEKHLEGCAFIRDGSAFAGIEDICYPRC
jgi:hypothetical protein